MSSTPSPIATAPASPVISDATLKADVVKDLTWIQGHILVALLAVSIITGGIIGGVSLVENLIEKHDARTAAAQQKQEGVDTATQQALLAQLQRDRAADAARDSTQTALIQSLAAQLTQQRTATAKQVQTDSTLDVQYAGTRLSEQTKAAPGDLTVTNNLITMSLPLTRVVIADLDQYQQSQNDVTNLQSQLGAAQILTSDAKTELADANKLVAADKLELVATVKADDAACVVSTNKAVDAQAAKDRKRGLWVAIGSAVLGALVRGAL